MESHDFVSLVGNTPLVHLRRASEETGCTILGKAEFLNPGQSVKDRAALFIIEDAEKRGVLRPGGTIVEGTAGNTGIGLALVGNAKGYRTVIVIPETQSQEKKDMIRLCGAELLEVPAVPYKNPNNYVRYSGRLAEALDKSLPNGAIWANQFDNVANRDGHIRTTGPEIWRQTDGKITHWVAGVGTGGTISGAGRYLKEQNPGIRVIGVDPVGSVYAHYKEHGELPPKEQIHQYLIDGIGEDLLPESVWMDVIDEILTVDDRSAYDAVFELARTESIFTGTSGAAAAVGARQVAADLGPDALVVTLFPDSGERYLSKLNETWMREKGLLDPVG
jgi:cysteine synthase A